MNINPTGQMDDDRPIEATEINKRYFDLLVCLQEAIAIGQAERIPIQSIINRWRRSCGWHEID